MALPVIITTGFLGCGKTSFLRRLIPLCAETGQRPALIINEVGDVDVDGESLADIHAEQVRLVGGCVCCTLQAQLSDTVYDVLERQACDLMIIECSGLSNPLDVVSALSAPALLREVAVSHIICLVDAGRVEKALAAVELARTQISGSDVVILNKIDTVDKDVSEKARALIDDYAPHAIIYETSYGDIGRENLLKLLNDPAPVQCACGCSHKEGHHRHHHHSHSLPASFCTVAYNLPDQVERESLENLMELLPENVIRAKGFANIEPNGWHILQKTYDAFDISPFGSKAPSTGSILVCIGQHLSADEIRAVVNITVGPRN